MEFTEEQRPVTISINNKSSEIQPIKVFFFERQDGTTFFIDERTAWETYKSRKFKYIGSSTGRIYFNAVKEAHQMFKTKGIEEAQKLLKTAVELELEEAKKNPEPPVSNDVFGDQKSVNTFKQTMRL